MKSDTAVVKKEVDEVLVDLDSDSDDSVVVVPYVKPKPPMISLDDSETEPETDSSKVLNETVVPTENDSFSPSLASTPVSSSISNSSEKVKKSKNRNRKSKEKDRTPRNTEQTSVGSIPSNSVNILETSKQDASPKKKNKRKNKESPSPTKKKKKRSDASASRCGISSADSSVTTTPRTGSRAEVLLSTDVNSATHGSVESVNGANRTFGVHNDTNTSSLANDESFVSSLSSEPPVAGTGETSTASLNVTVESLEGSKKKGGKRKRRKDLGDAAVVAAKEEFTSFLKTLNLTSNIGMNDKDMQMIAALSPADLVGPVLNPKKRAKSTARKAPIDDSTRAVATASVLAEEGVTLPSESGEAISPSRDQNTIDQSSDDTSTVEEPPVVKEKDSTSSNPAEAEESTTAPTFAFVSVVDEAANKRGKNKTDASGLKKSPKVPKVLATGSGNLEKVVTVAPQNHELITLDAEDSEDEGFTNEELNQVKSNIRLNITGGQNELSLLELSSTLSSDKHLNSQKSCNGKMDAASVDPEHGTSLSKRKQKISESENSRIKNIQENVLSKRTKTSGDEDASNSNIVDQNQDRRRISECTDVESQVQTSDCSGSSSVNPKGGNRSLNKTHDVCFPASWTQEMIAFYGTIDETDLTVEDILERQSDSHRLWRIPVDMQPQRRRGKPIRCSNCNNFGYHTPNRCPEPRKIPKCVMCGSPGHTTNCLYANNNNSSKNAQRFTVTKCLKALCLNCGRRFHNQHDRKFVQACDYCYKNSSKCQCCGENGHREPDCPDSWRRFHSTVVDYDDSNLRQQVKTGEFVGQLQKTTYRRKYDQYCSNCARKGHNYYHCDQRKDYNAVFIPTCPYIAQELPVPSQLAVDQQSGAIDSDPSSITGEGADFSSVSSVVNSNVDNLNQNYFKGPAPATAFGQNYDSDIASSCSSDSKLTSKNASCDSIRVEACLDQKGNQKLRKSIEHESKPVKDSKLQPTSSSNNDDDSDIEILDVIQYSPRKEPAAAKSVKAKKNKTKESSNNNGSSVVKCRDFPDCKNTSPAKTLCFKIKIAKSDNHKVLLRLNEKHGLVEKLQQLYGTYDVHICLLKKSAEFHLSGRQFYRARDRIARLVKNVNNRSEIFTLLPELYPEGNNSITDDIKKANSPQVEITTSNSKSNVKEHSMEPKKFKFKSKSTVPPSDTLPPKRKDVTSTSVPVTPASNKSPNRKIVTTPCSEDSPAKKSANLLASFSFTLDDDPTRKSTIVSPVSSPGPINPPAVTHIGATKTAFVSTEVNHEIEGVGLDSAKGTTDAEAVSSGTVSSQSAVAKEVESNDSAQGGEFVDTAVTRYEFDRKIRRIMVQSARRASLTNVVNDVLETSTESAKVSKESSSGETVVSDSKTQNDSHHDNDVPRTAPDVSTFPIPPVSNPFASGFRLNFPPVVYIEPNPAHDVDERVVPVTELQKSSLVPSNSPFACNPFMNFFPYQRQQQQVVSFPYMVTNTNPGETSYFTTDICANSVVENDSSGFIISDP